MGKRFNPQPLARYDQSLLPTLNQNFQQLSRLLASIPTEFIGSIAPDDPYLGQPWVDTTTWTIRVWDGTGWRPGDWTSFTPVWTQNVTLTKTLTSESAYEKRGKTVKFQSHYNITSAGTAGQPIQSTIPFNNVGAGNRNIGTGFYFNGVGNLGLLAYAASATLVRFIRTDNGATLGSDGTTAASGHALTFDIEYEATT